MQQYKARRNLYGQSKSQVSFSLTPDASAGLDDMARQHRLSRSELIERFGRGLLDLGMVTKTQTRSPEITYTN